MKLIHAKKWMVAAIFIFCFQLTYAQTLTPADNFILNYMNQNNIPGLSAGIIKDGKLALAKGYGYADIDKDIPFTPNTINHSIASVSKTITATALFQLWENDLFELDDPINDYLPFPVSNPFYPDIPITFRMLLSHKSSIYSNEQEPVNVEYGLPGTRMPLGEFLQKRLVPGGTYYNFRFSSFNNFPPGTVYLYSNAGYALLGYLVERISGMPFNEYCNQYIFQPLCMNNTGWYFSEIDISMVSRPYDDNGTREMDLYENTLYPSGQLKTSIVDLSKFLLMHMNYGILDGIRIIASTTEVMMRQPECVVVDDPGNVKEVQCLGLKYVYFYPSGDEYIGHDGGTYGVATEMWANITQNTGTIVFQNRWFVNHDIQVFLETQVRDTLSTALKPLLTCSYSFDPCQQLMEYWQNNTAQWAINSVPMKLGKHYYSKPQILNLLSLPINNDASRVLAKALITAKFNIAQGSELAPIVTTYNAAMDLLGGPPLPYSNPVLLNSATGIQMLTLAATLDSYNAGNMNTTPCSENAPSITQRNILNEKQSAEKKHSISVYPNPSHGSASVSFYLPKAGKVSLLVYDIAGRLVKIIANKELNEGDHTLDLDIKNFNAGVYLLRMQSNGILKTKKFMIQH